MSKSWLTRSKNLDRSTSTAKRRPVLIMLFTCFTACCPFRCGLNPKLLSEKVGSKIGVRTWAIACWITRSTIVGIPNWRFPPSGLSISTRFTGEGWYWPERSSVITRFQFPAFAQAGKSSMVMPSMPAAPLLARTCFHADTRLEGWRKSSSRSALKAGCSSVRWVTSLPDGIRVFKSDKAPPLF